MTKLSRKPLPVEHMGYYINNLWSAFTLAGSKEDIKLLFKDLFTHTEYKMFAKRLEIARRLLSGDRYEDIKKILNVTEQTIAKISNALIEKGAGFRKTHELLLEVEQEYENQRKQQEQNLANPFLYRVKARQKILLGQALRAGVKALDKKIIKGIKYRSAKKLLTI